MKAARQLRGHIVHQLPHTSHDVAGAVTLLPGTFSSLHLSDTVVILTNNLRSDVILTISAFQSLSVSP